MRIGRVLRSVSRASVGRVVPALLVLLAAQAALAHAHLHASDPAMNSVVAEAPTEFTLTFTEGVEGAFSRFELYRIDETAVPGADDDAAWDALAEDAQALSERVLAASPAGSHALKLLTDGASETIHLAYEGEPLLPGVYVVVFKVASVDTHTSSGYLLFGYLPGE